MFVGKQRWRPLRNRTSSLAFSFEFDEIFQTNIFYRIILGDCFRTNFQKETNLIRLTEYSIFVQRFQFLQMESISISDLKRLEVPQLMIWVCNLKNVYVK